jgi:GPH family glycoside/pentoside/hexuronide:cation symporter
MPPDSPTPPSRLDAATVAIYATGQFGWSLASYAVLNQLPYFYMPPTENGEAVFPPFIHQGPLWLGLTLLGLLAAGGRLFDAVSDPLIAAWSDRFRSRWGRRRPFLLAAALPFAVLSAAVFHPPSAAPAANALWLGVTLTLFYAAMTAYVVPYNALIAELGRTARERLTLSTAISFTWAAGFMTGSTVFALQGAWEDALGPTTAFQRVLGLFAAVSALAMLVPGLLLDENRLVARQADADPGLASARRVWSDRNFRWFAASDFLYWLAVTFIVSGMVYYVTELLGRDKAFATAFFAPIFLGSLLCYLPVSWWARRAGKRRVLMAGFATFAGAFALTAGLRPGLPAEGAWLAALGTLAAVSLAIFGILPNAVVGDLADAEARRTGRSVAGMYFAVRTLVMKAGTAAAMLVFNSFLAWGTGGVRATALAALGFCLAGALAFSRYREPGPSAGTALSGEGPGNP